MKSDYILIRELMNKLRFEESLRQLFEETKNKEDDWFMPLFFVHDEVIIEIPAKPLLLEYKDENKIHNE